MVREKGRGKPTNVERLKREKALSVENILEFVGNKRKERGVGQKNEGEEGDNHLVKNRKMERTPEKENTEGGKEESLIGKIRKAARENIRKKIGEVGKKVNDSLGDEG